MRVWGMRLWISIMLTASDHGRLTVLVADRNTPQKHVWRANIVLLSAEGVGTVEIMRRRARRRPASGVGRNALPARASKACCATRPVRRGCRRSDRCHPDRTTASGTRVPLGRRHHRPRQAPRPRARRCRLRASHRAGSPILLRGGCHPEEPHRRHHARRGAGPAPRQHPWKSSMTATTAARS